MLTLQKELSFKDRMCPHYKGFREMDFLDLSVAEEFIEYCWELDQDIFPLDVALMSDTDIKAISWLIYHEWSKGCLQYEADDLYIRKTKEQ